MKLIKIDNVSGDEITCHCPWHDDKHGSLGINLKKNVAYCFVGCFSGTAVDCISLASEKTINYVKAKFIRNEIDSFFDRSIYQSNEHKFLNGVFTGTVNDWKKAIDLEYLRNRGFFNSSIEYWGIEYSDSIRHIRIPVRDENKTLMGYIYRTIDNLVPKYLYSKGFRKKSTLFGADLNNFDKKRSILVEGSLDAIWLWQSGILSSFAILGSIISLEQSEILKKKGVESIILCFDNDLAGKRARSRSMKMLDWADISTVLLPEGVKDIQEIPMREVQYFIRRAIKCQKV